MLMSAARDPVALFRFALREGDHALAAALARSFRSDPALARRADSALRAQPRGSAIGRADRALLGRLARAARRT
jgi:hypothetical protein